MTSAKAMVANAKKWLLRRKQGYPRIIATKMEIPAPASNPFQGDREKCKNNKVEVYAPIPK